MVEFWRHDREYFSGRDQNRITKNETSFFASSHLPTLKMFTKLAVGKFDMKMVGLKNPFV